MSDIIEYHEEPVTLHSGQRSHWRINADAIFEREDLREAVLAWAVRWAEHEHAFSTKGRQGFKVWGIPQGGTSWAEALRDRLVSSRLDDPIRILVDDVLTTGASIARHLTVRNYDLVLVVVNRNERDPSPRVHAYWRIPLPVLEAQP